MKACTALSLLIALCLFTQTPVFAQGNTWKKVRYNGGTVATKTDPDDWDNTLTVRCSR